jgi:hypothetical protein
MILLAGVIQAACSSSSDSGSGGSSGSGGQPDAGAGFGQSACGTCVKTACQNELGACSNDPGCASFVACLDACPVDTDGNVLKSCAIGCPTPSSSVGQSARAAFESCRATGAGAACPACGVDSGTVDAGKPENPILADQDCAPSQSTGCIKCYEEKCCKLRSCLDDADCSALASCVAGCSAGWDCESKCYEAHPQSTVKYAEYYGCVSIFCPGSDADCTTETNQTLACIVVNECRQQYADCYANESCYLIVQCALDCNGETACIEACKSAHPDGIDGWGAMIVCWEQKCGYTG